MREIQIVSLYHDIPEGKYLAIHSGNHLIFFWYERPFVIAIDEWVMSDYFVYFHVKNKKFFLEDVCYE